MHIPSADTAALTILPFDEALTAALEPSAEYDVNQWLYVPNTYADYRYLLGTRGERPLICVGINPSTAAPDRLDNTLKSVERIAQGNGFDSFLMFNVYAQRATRPKDMEKTCNPFLHRENMRAFDYVLSLSPEPAVWAAWGHYPAAGLPDGLLAGHGGHRSGPCCALVYGGCAQQTGRAPPPPAVPAKGQPAGAL